MKRIKFAYQIALIVCVCLSTYIYSPGQTFGIGIGGATSKTLIGDVTYIRGSNRFHLGFGLQKDGQKGQAYSERGSNYGLTEAGRGDYFTCLDIGYSKVIREKFTVQPELTFGWIRHYVNYVDRRFKSDLYHLITSSQSTVGVGFNFGYIVHKNFEVYTGYNTIKKLTLVVRILI